MLYGNSGFSFGGWKVNPAESFGADAWQPIRTPQASDYVPSPPPLAKPSDYVPIAKTEPVLPPVSTIAEPPPPSFHDSRKYGVQELQRIGSGSPSEIIEFFQNLNGAVIQKDSDPDGHVLTIYSHPALPDKNYISYGENRGFWQIFKTIPPVPTSDDTVSLPGVSVRPIDAIQLSDSEIAAIIEQQNKPLPPEPPKSEEPPPAQFDSDAVLLTPLPVPQEKPSIEHMPSIGHTVISHDVQRNPPELKPIPQPEAPAQNHHGAGGGRTEPAPTHPQDQAQNILGNLTSSAEVALKNPHAKFLEEADNLKQQFSIQHDLASDMSQQIMQLEEGHIYDERRAYYAQNREALNEAVEKLRANTAELAQQHGEVKGKLYMVGGMMKMLGGIGLGLDVMELFGLSKTAYETGDWAAVQEKIAKMVISTAATASIAGTARLVGIGLAALGVSTGVIVSATVVGAAIFTYYTIDYINKNSLEDMRHDFSIGGSRSENGHKEYDYSDLVVFGGSRHTATPTTSSSLPKT